jgi:hypothetical protein
VLRDKVRAALAGTTSFEQFTERLRRDGVLVRPRMSTVNPDEITGYAVALPPTGPDAAAGVEPVWFGGGKLAADLTFPQLQARWCGDPEAHDRSARPAATGAAANRAGLELDPAERQLLWEAAGQAIGRADATLRAAVGGDPATRAMADAAAVAASEVLTAVGRLTERSSAGPLHQAAAAYDRAARGLRRQPPIPTSTGRRTRRAAGALRGMEFVRRADTRHLLQLVQQLSQLSLTLAALREQQGRAAQAAAARRAAELLTTQHSRRSNATQASVHRLTTTPQTSRTAGSAASRGPARQLAFS